MSGRPAYPNGGFWKRSLRQTQGVSIDERPTAIATPGVKIRRLELLQVVGRGDLAALQATVLHGLVYSADPSGRG